ncbi:MAG: ATP-binding protein, partial [Candidatus Omnitrophota bacterium]
EWTGIFLHGETGIGKTHMAAALAKTAMDESERGTAHGLIWVSSPELLLTIRATFNGQGNEAQIVQKYSTVPTLVIDDFGAEKITDWSISSFYLILANRVNWLRKTIVTSNMTLAEIKSWEPRIASRLAGFDVCLCPGKKDRRLLK